MQTIKKNGAAVTSYQKLLLQSDRKPRYFIHIMNSLMLNPFTVLRQHFVQSLIKLNLPGFGVCLHYIGYCKQYSVKFIWMTFQLW